MKLVDRLLQRQRIKRAIHEIGPNDFVLDVGCHSGELFKSISGFKITGVGVDSDLGSAVSSDAFSFIRGEFPECMVGTEYQFDVICALAVLEHVPEEKVSDFVAQLRRLVSPDGRVIFTVPSPLVDRILDVLLFLKLIDGMDAEHHHGFKVSDVEPRMRQAGFVLDRHERFQFGLNNKFVFVPER